MKIIAGPCSAETEEQVMTTVGQLAAMGIKTIRAGVWKPRSRANNFEGVGESGLFWLRRAEEEFGVKTMVEVGMPSHIESVVKAGISKVWIGARTTVNPFMVQELASLLSQTDIKVMIKNPACPDLELWIGAVERFLLAGVKELSLIHRGFAIVEKEPYRNAPLWNIVQQMKAIFPHLPLYCDPSHICGCRELIGEIIDGALSQDYPVAGFFIESHCCPGMALSDMHQQLTPADLKTLLSSKGLL